MADKVIRIWSGCKVLQVVSVGENGGSTTLGATGGADSSTRVDIEIDPFAGTIVDHSVRIPPQAFREDAQEFEGRVAGLALKAVLTAFEGFPPDNHPVMISEIRSTVRDVATDLGIDLS